jgi:lipoprotein-releasing system permease protein
VSTISRFSILVLSIAYFSFLTILSVFSGLEQYSLSFSKSFDPDIKIEAMKGVYLSFTNEIDSVLLTNKDVLHYGKTVKGNVVVRYGERTEYAQILGVDDNFNKVIDVDSVINIGRMPTIGTNEAITSYELTSNLDLILYNPSGIFDVLSLNPGYPEASFNPIRNVSPLISTGVFKSRNDLNKNLIITSIETVQDLFGLNRNQFSEILIKSSKDVTKDIKQDLKNLKVRSHKELNETLFKIMNSEKIIIALIMIMIVFISTFNVIASTVMLIVEKEDNIKTLQSLGMTKRNVEKLFFKHNLLINIMGGAIGLLISIALVFSQSYYSIFKIPGLDIAYPVSLEINNILFVAFTLFVAGLFSGYVSSLTLKKLR